MRQDDGGVDAADRARRAIPAGIGSLVEMADHLDDVAPREVSLVRSARSRNARTVCQVVMVMATSSRRSAQRAAKRLDEAGPAPDIRNAGRSACMARCGSR